MVLRYIFQNQPTITHFYIPVPSMTYLKTITFQCNFWNDRKLNSGEMAKIEIKAAGPQVSIGHRK